MTISVLIATYRRPAELHRCLEALSRQTLAPTEVIVVGREGDRETQTLLAERGSTLPLKAPLVREPGVVAALNAGLRLARGDVVALTDDDAVPRPCWLERIAARFDADSGTGAVGGRDVVHIGDGVLDGQVKKVGRIHWFGRAIGSHHLRTGLQRVDFLKGVNTAYRRQPLLSFDEALRGVGAQVAWDMDASLSFRERGWTVLYDPDIVVDHYPAERFDEDRRSEPTIGALRNAVHNETYVLLKWLPWWKKAITLAYGLLVGSRRAPGLLLVFERLAREAGRRSVLERFGAAMRGRFTALGTFVRLLRKEEISLVHVRSRAEAVRRPPT